jgi:hypothetical protein
VIEMDAETKRYEKESGIEGYSSEKKQEEIR